ncbi:MAG: hypothetical protein JW904_08615 [Spirochaetales bacterium]|nr:hypothetical protein [Spirochaetales bacterium]
MSVRHPRAVEWEDRLKSVFDRIDDYLEEKYGGQFPLHPRRQQRGTTSNKEHDGLFNIGASFGLGYGSSKGKGYIVEIRIVTLEPVPDDIMSDIYTDTMRLLQKELDAAFPEKKLKVEKDGEIVKITGDFSLGKAHEDH